MRRRGKPTTYKGKRLSKAAICGDKTTRRWASPIRRKKKKTSRKSKKKSRKSKKRRSSSSSSSSSSPPTSRSMSSCSKFAKKVLRGVVTRSGKTYSDNDTKEDLCRKLVRGMKKKKKGHKKKKGGRKLTSAQIKKISKILIEGSQSDCTDGVRADAMRAFVKARGRPTRYDGRVRKLAHMCRTERKHTRDDGFDDADELARLVEANLDADAPSTGRAGDQLMDTLLRRVSESTGGTPSIPTVATIPELRTVTGNKAIVRMSTEYTMHVTRRDGKWVINYFYLDNPAKLNRTFGGPAMARGSDRVTYEGHDVTPVRNASEIRGKPDGRYFALDEKFLYSKAGDNIILEVGDVVGV